MEAPAQQRRWPWLPEAAGVLIRALTVWLLVVGSFALYAIVVHPFVPRVPFIDGLANQLSSIRGMSAIVHARATYFFFLAPWVAGYAQVRWRHQSQPGDLLLAWLGGWVGLAVAAWLFTGYQPFPGYQLAMPLWEAPGIVHLLVPTACYFIVLMVASLGAVVLTRSTAPALCTFGAAIGLVLIGVTWDDWQWVQRVEAVRAITSDESPDLQRLAAAALTGHLTVRQAAVIRLGMELRAHPERADAIVPHLVAVAQPHAPLELHYLALRILKGDELWMVPGQATGLREGGGVPFPQQLRQRADIAAVLQREADDPQWEPAFRVQLRKAAAAPDHVGQ